jgi:type II secretory pathway pseudopilin PulG
MQARRANSQESGFAMLVVFLLAAIVAISLYMELPRVVMESQRAKEQLLLDRGEQYKRAVQVYYRTLRRYPLDLDALENTNNRRFLRKRYKDPMTGEDNWRLIHVAGGVFTDSLLTQSPAQTTQTASASASDTGQQVPAPWLQARASDRILTVDPMLGNTAPPAGDAEENAPPAPGQPPAGAPSVNIMPFLAQPGIGQNQPAVSPTGPGAEGQPATIGPVATTPSNPAAEIINRILTTPSPAAMQVIQQANSGQPGGGGRGAVSLGGGGFMMSPRPLSGSTQQQQLGGAGIAGVASQLEAEGIKIYNDRTKYNEWEFTYDARQDPIAVRMMMQTNQQQQGGPGGRGAQTGPQPGTPGSSGNQRGGGNRGPGPGGPGPGGGGGFPPGGGRGGPGPGRGPGR